MAKKKIDEGRVIQRGVMGDGPFAGFHVIEVDPGDTVVCDCCNGDYTESKKPGGLIFGSNAACPDCAPEIKKSAMENGEMDEIAAEARPGQPFGDFVREYRARRRDQPHPFNPFLG